MHKHARKFDSTLKELELKNQFELLEKDFKINLIMVYKLVNW